MLTYRKDIDGLRAIAVLSVIFFHFSIPGFSGGFTGVDIFFVISGYLIGSIILSGLTGNTFSFASFYERRIRRIFPALYAMIITCLLFSFFFLDSSFLKELGKTAETSILFVSNIFFYNTKTGYFVKETGSETLLHTWSLSIEEQFYLFFPVFIYLVNKYWRKYMLAVIVFLFIASVVASALLTKPHPAFSFYLPFTRIWELLAGVIIAKINPFTGNKSFKQIVSIAGISLLAVSLALINNKSLFPGYIALLPVAGSALILFAGNDSSLFTNKLLSFQPLVFTGKISYSLYLWHWPVKVFGNYFYDHTLTITTSSILIGITFVLSVLSWRFIEQPFRRKNGLLQTRKKLFAAAAITSIALLFISFFIVSKNGFPGHSWENKILSEAESENLWPQLVAYDNYSKKLSSQHELAVIGDKQSTPDFILWGDSHAATIASGFEATALAKQKSGFVAITLGDPPVIPGDRETNNPDLGSINQSVLQFISDHPTIKKVFLCARWTAYRESSASNNNIKTLTNVPFDNELRAVISKLDSMHREVFIIGPTPELATLPGKYFFQHKFFHQEINSLTPTKESFLQRHAPTFSLLENLAHDSNVHLIYIYEPLFKNDKIILVENDHLLYIDEHHLSTWGALKIVEAINADL